MNDANECIRMAVIPNIHKQCISCSIFSVYIGKVKDCMRHFDYHESIWWYSYTAPGLEQWHQKWHGCYQNTKVTNNSYH